MAKPKSDVDWVAVEREYRTGILSNVALGKRYGVTEGSIRKRAIAHEWTRDLQPQIAARTSALVYAAAGGDEFLKKAISAREDASCVEAVALVQSQVVVDQQRSVVRYEKLAEKLLLDLEAHVDQAELLKDLGELMHSPDAKGHDRLHSIYMRVIDHPAKVDSFKKLTETYKTLIALKRQAVGLADNANGEANTPQVEVSNEDAARRVAFLLVEAARKKEK